MFQGSHAQSATMSKLREYMSQQHSAEPFSADEMEAALQRMTDANQIMVADDMVFLI